MKSSARSSSPLAARVSKLIGIVLILGALLDYLVLLINPTPGFLDAGWRVATFTQIVDRGIIPMIGMVFAMIGYWIESSTGMPLRTSISKLLILGLAAFLGLVFLLLAPMTFLDIGRQRDTALQRISQEASQAEGQIDPRLQAEVQRQRNIIGSLLKDDRQLAQAIAAGALPSEQVNLLQKFKQNPQSVEEFLDTQSKQARDKLQAEIRIRKEEAEKQTNSTAFKTRLRTCVSSLLIAAGYALIGFMGLREAVGISRST